jgi:hypothetical protein
MRNKQNHPSREPVLFEADLRLTRQINEPTEFFSSTSSITHRA